jgi:hypothetical protein
MDGDTFSLLNFPRCDEDRNTGWHLQRNAPHCADVLRERLFNFSQSF